MQVSIIKDQNNMNNIAQELVVKKILGSHELLALDMKPNGHLLEFYERAKQRRNLRNNLGDVSVLDIFMAV